MDLRVKKVVCTPVLTRELKQKKLGRTDSEPELLIQFVLKFTTKTAKTPCICIAQVNKMPRKII